MPMLKKRWDGVSARASSRRISVFGESTGTIDMNQGAADKLPKVCKHITYEVTFDERTENLTIYKGLWDVHKDRF